MSTKKNSFDRSPKYVAVYVEPCEDSLPLAIRRLAWVVYDSNQSVLAEESHCSRSDSGRGPIGRLPPAFVRAVRSLPPDDGYVAAHGMIRAHLLLRRKFREVGLQSAWDNARKCCTRNSELLRVAREDRAIGSGEGGEGMGLRQVYDLLMRPGEGGAGALSADGVEGAVSVPAAAAPVHPVEEACSDADEALERARKTGRIFFWYKNSPKHRHQCLEWLVEDYFVLGGGHNKRTKRTRNWDVDPGTPPSKRRFKRLPQEEVPDDEMRRMTVKTANGKGLKKAVPAGLER
eukprot:CAMPEP_0197455036 /NCGR_PEP_ID=MMETSP1175-20131217/39692_1 /TAXON_ID=1003142 /ORGANISM="Triceratium dubium, Strain CCMP147" /LENGTH=288 /DNA_ID=CAMNT_0042988777 /DNA_START=129 /DNA_END=995 /DNA_ORIENTATION=+